MVEQLAVNQRVVGSSPTSGAIFFLVFFLGNRSDFRHPHFNCQQNCQQICALVGDNSRDMNLQASH